MDYLYSLYDALVSINVPNDKARAVVDAMERDMGTTLATKADVDLLKQSTKADLDLLKQATKADLQLLRQEIAGLVANLATRQETTAIRAEVAELRQDMALIRKDMELLSASMTARLGSMMVVTAGFLFAALKLT